MSLADIQTQVAGLLNRRDCTMLNNPGLVNTFISQGLARIQRNLRIPSMERSFLLTADTGVVQAFSAPIDLLQVIDVVALGPSNPQILDKLAFRQIVVKGSAVVDTPRYYARNQAAFFVYPILPIGGSIFLTYYGTFQPLTASTDENEITLAAPDLLVYAALSYAADYYLMDTKDAWEGRYGELVQDVDDEARQLDATGGPSSVSSAYGEEC